MSQKQRDFVKLIVFIVILVREIQVKEPKEAIAPVAKAMSTNLIPLNLANPFPLNPI